MVHQIVLCKLNPGTALERIEYLMRQTRSCLLRIAEFRTVTCGKRIESSNEWAFFFAADFESLDKMQQGHRTLAFQRFTREVLLPYVKEQVSLIYELDPAKDIKYS